MIQPARCQPSPAKKPTQNQTRMSHMVTVTGMLMQRGRTGQCSRPLPPARGRSPRQHGADGGADQKPADPIADEIVEDIRPADAVADRPVDDAVALRLAEDLRLRLDLQKPDCAEHQRYRN